jgi:hypothetical protein
MLDYLLEDYTRDMVELILEIFKASVFCNWGIFYKI